MDFGLGADVLAQQRQGRGVGVAVEEVENVGAEPRILAARDNGLCVRDLRAETLRGLPAPRRA